MDPVIYWFSDQKFISKCAIRTQFWSSVLISRMKLGQQRRCFARRSKSHGIFFVIYLFVWPATGLIFAITLSWQSSGFLSLIIVIRRLCISADVLYLVVFQIPTPLPAEFTCIPSTVINNGGVAVWSNFCHEHLSVYFSSYFGNLSTAKSF